VVITGLPDWPKGDRKEFVLGSVKATPQTTISVLGQNDQVTEYKNQLDVHSRFEQKEDGLHISVARAQRVYDNYKWPNPITVKLENIEPALDPPQVETGDAIFKNGMLELNARVLKKGNADSLQLNIGPLPDLPKTCIAKTGSKPNRLLSTVKGTSPQHYLV
jgi:alpha-L-fucosidase